VELKRTPLEDDHKRLGAKMAPFGGWLMPIEYAGVLTEHRAVREAVGMFDLTHLGKVDVRGEGALAWLQRIVTNDLSELAPGEAQYNLVLTEQGGIVDDLIVYRTGEAEYLVVPNAGNTDRILGILREGAPGGVEIAHRPDLATIAVQGPAAFDLVTPRFPAAEKLDFMTHAEADFDGAPVLIARSGYTGERGVELFVPDGAAGALWEELLEAGRWLGLEPAGLAARDTLRLEMGYPLHGSDITDERTPLEALLSWAVAFDKGEFTGRDALLRMREAGVPARLRGLRMTGRLIPRPHYAVLSGDRRVGETTSGTFSPTLRVGIAMAYLDPDVELGQVVEVDVRGKRGGAEVVRPPFVDASPK